MFKEENLQLQKEHEQCMAIYESSKEVAEMADRIHNSRMGSGKACDQCIRMAINQLEKESKQSPP